MDFPDVVPIEHDGVLGERLEDSRGDFFSLHPRYGVVIGSGFSGPIHDGELAQWDLPECAI